MKQKFFQTPALRIRVILAAIMVVPFAAHAWEQGGPTNEGYTEEPFFWSRANPARDFDFSPVGVTGLVIDIKKGKVVTVRETTPSTPAAGQFQKGDILTAVNGESFEGRDPQQVLGLALADAEAGDGRLVFAVMAGKEKRDVAIIIPVTGPYFAAYRLRVLAPRAYQVFLNGNNLHQYIWFKTTPHYASVIFGDRQTKFLKEGANTLGIYLNRTDRRGPAQMDAVIEGLVLDGTKGP